MTEYTDIKSNLASRYLNTPPICSLFAYVAVTLFSLSFFKVLEARIVFDFLEPHKNEKICDLACECGEQSIRLLKRGCQVVGTDFDKKSITIAQAFSEKNNFVLATAEKLPFRSNIFDKVVSVRAGIIDFANNVNG